MSRNGLFQETVGLSMRVHLQFLLNSHRPLDSGREEARFGPVLLASCDQELGVTRAELREVPGSADRTLYGGGTHTRP